ncbi:hypothetical protein RRG08_013725 [Elysia crispata]|uniref:Uncharacterized protein n=1 Tax=Elysia crispata TaxID=231223 RepID=A0AAE0ZPB5_9GAST|nr:hypothetical protein RRG08_013725 [Elysia crispata]
MKMTAAKQGAININGALILRISGTSSTKNTLETKQMVYFSTSTDKMFLSKDTCIALRMIPPTFLIISGTYNIFGKDKEPIPTLLQPHHCYPVTALSVSHHRRHLQASLSQPLTKTESASKSGSWIIIDLAASLHVSTNLFQRCLDLLKANE